MAMKSPRVRALLRQAQRTAESGKRAAAQQLYRQILDEEPQTLEAWLGLARVSPDAGERQEALQRALALDPGNSAASKLLGEGQGAGDGKPYAEKAAGLEGENEVEDPFAQSRAWLDEATARRRDGATTREAPAPRAAPAKPEPRSTEKRQAPPAKVDVDLDTAPVLTCYRHPQRETALRCITCDRPICTRCATHTPVGYRCPQCIREAQDVFFSANVLDYVLTGVVTLVLAVIAGLIAPRLGFFVIFIGPAAGTLIGRLAFRLGRRRHGRYLPQLVAAMVALGGLLPTVLPMALALLVGAASLGSLGFGLLWPLVYVFLATSAAYYQVK